MVIVDMATLLILTHDLDGWRRRPYIASVLLPHIEAAGHEVVVRGGISGLPPADVAWLHVDLTVVPEEYLEALRPYPVVVNRRVVDIGKRSFSRQLLSRGDAYDGPVIVKTNLNSGGWPEHACKMFSVGGPRGYDLYPFRQEVPEPAWSDAGLVVEKFLPEHDERGYYLRCWTFFGDRERCVRVLAPQPVVKGRDTLEIVHVPVPDELRAERLRLGFDYGKFDFAMRQGEPVLFDVNRTPTIPVKISSSFSQNLADLSLGIGAFLGKT